jgi:sugar lactone lactonase YvrE
MTKYASGMMWGEGPRWRDGALWLSDTQGSRLWTDASGVWAPTELESVSNGLWFLPDGRLVGALMHEQRIGVWTGAGWDTYADLSHLRPGPLGDLVGDSNGNLYVDDVAYALHKGEKPRPGRLLFVGADRASRVVVDDLNFPNGLTFLHDERTLVVAETTSKRLTSFRVDEHGDLHDRRLYADVAALVGSNAAPDGIWATQDRVWVATLGGHAVVLVHDGKLVRSIDTGEAFPIACCSDDNSRLFVTIADTAGQSLMDAVACKAISTSVFVYEIENRI